MGRVIGVSGCGPAKRPGSRSWEWGPELRLDRTIRQASQLCLLVHRTLVWPDVGSL